MLATPMTPTKRAAGLLLATILYGLRSAPTMLPRRLNSRPPTTRCGHTPTTPAPQLDRWWTGFNDPVLVTIVQRVLDQDLDPTAALARVEQARQAASAAGAELLPTVDLDASATAQRQSVESPLGSLAGSLPGYNRDQREYTLELAASWEIARIFRLGPVSESSNRLSSLNRQEHCSCKQCAYMPILVVCQDPVFN